MKTKTVDPFPPDNPDRLSARALELFKLIEYESQHSPYNGWISRKQEYFASKLGICRQYVQKLIKKLVTADLIEIIRRDHNFYRAKSSSDASDKT